LSFLIVLECYSMPISEDTFKNINNDFLHFFKQQAPQDVRIRINANWEVNYPAASTDRSTDFELTKNRRPIEWDISILSGYMRHEDGGIDVHLFALCHEMAHHLGGQPYKTDEEGKKRWASMEAQADYWATKTCLPQFLSANNKYMKQQKIIHPEIKRRCQREFWTWFSNYQYCIFSAQAAYKMGKIHDKNRLPSEPITNPVDPNTSAPDKVIHLDRNIYPSNQCRFDTALHGALQKERPPCWYPEPQ
jgi:hypothetical protein